MTDFISFISWLPLTATLMKLLLLLIFREFFEVCQAERRGFEFLPCLMSPKGPSSIFFLFCKRMDVQKLPKGPFYIFRHYATYRRPKKFGKKFQKIGFFSIFSSRGYCRNGFATTDVENAKGSPFQRAPGAPIRSNVLGFSGTVEENTLTL